MKFPRAFALVSIAAWSVLAAAPSAPLRLPLDSTAGLKLHNLQAEPVTLDGKRGLRVTLSDAELRSQVANEAITTAMAARRRYSCSLIRAPGNQIASKSHLPAGSKGN
jgi:hypothetical protein